MPNKNDPKGYYSALGVKSTATQDEIKKAFRKLAKELHPDSNRSDPAATRKFQNLSEAYEILCDPERRARYDVTDAEASVEGASNPAAPIEPIICSICKTITAQPRYVIFWRVISFIVVTHRQPIQGIFCPKCAASVAIKNSCITWVFGWWGFPWGPLWALRYLFENLIGGEKPDKANGIILGRQALYFMQNGRLDLARELLDKALSFKVLGELHDELVRLRAQAGVASKSSQLIDRWSWKRSIAFRLQLLPIALVAGLIGFSVWSDASAPVQFSPFLAHAGEQGLALLQQPHGSIGERLAPFENVTVTSKPTQDGVVQVRTRRNTIGYAMSSTLHLGDGLADFQLTCASGAQRPFNGTIFLQTKMGKHHFQVHNGLAQDAIVKLSDPLVKKTVLSFYVQANSDTEIGTVPDGVYEIIFATGTNFSERCGLFLSNMHAQRFNKTESFQTTYENNYVYHAVLSISLNPVPGGTAHTGNMDGESFVLD